MKVKFHRAVEALRAGVPNRDAVSQLGTDQKRIETRFAESLSQVASERQEGRQVPGLLVVGDFGSGKSHLFEWLQHLALEQNFACSKIVVSKETPLGNPHRVFRAAMDSLRLPNLTGGLDEVAAELEFSSARYADFYRRVQDPGSGFDPLFQGTLFLFEKLNLGDDLRTRIVPFWRGDRIKVAEVRKSLRQIAGPSFALKARKAADLALPRFRFTAELLHGAGYSGWVVLLDEVELIMNYSRLARARSYVTLAILLGLVPRRHQPGLLTAASIVPDLAHEVFERRHDRENIPQLLGTKLGDQLAACESGMEVLNTDRRWLRIEAQGPDALNRTFEAVRKLYGDAYEWEPGDGGVEVLEGSHPMRKYVRAWITRWDLQRLDPGYSPEIETHDPNPIRDVMREMEQSSAGGDEDDEPA